MAIRFYDAAVCNKIKNWVKDPNLKVLSPSDASRLFQLKADENLDKPLTLPLIAISRDENIEIISTAKKALTYDGGHIKASPETSELLNGIPIKSISLNFTPGLSSLSSKIVSIPILLNSVYSCSATCFCFSSLLLIKTIHTL